LNIPQQNLAVVGDKRIHRKIMSLTSKGSAEMIKIISKVPRSRDIDPVIARTCAQIWALLGLLSSVLAILMGVAMAKSSSGIAGYLFSLVSIFSALLLFLCHFLIQNRRYEGMKFSIKQELAQAGSQLQNLEPHTQPDAHSTPQSSNALSTASRRSGTTALASVRTQPMSSSTSGHQAPAAATGISLITATRPSSQFSVRRQDTESMIGD
jgi:hypothetical protein